MPRHTPRLLAILMASAALCACSVLGEAPEAAEKSVVREKAPEARRLADNLDSNVAQARTLRMAGKYDESIQILSQLMLVATDNPSVVAEYGKALAQRGDAKDATQFLRRAIELSPGDWTIYSALGVAYDQTGDQESARNAYERALVLRPGEASVLNNYALSRLLANEPQAAQRLIEQAKAGSKPDDAKIARNVALINEMMPAAPKPVQVASSGKGSPAPVAVAQAPKPAPVAIAKAMPPIPVIETPAPQRQVAPAPQRVAAAAPRALVPQQQNTAPSPNELEQTALAVAEQTAGVPDRSVVMQAVPFDPLAGPVKPKAKPRATVAAAKKAAPVQQAQIPSLRVATEKY
jgi:Flp pilus assembly protein TadD